jgi:hypothetical protein
MLRKIYLFIVIGFMFCAAASARAQSIRAHIPFDFYVNSKKLPAGDYSISRVSELNPQVLQIRISRFVQNRTCWFSIATAKIISFRKSEFRRSSTPNCGNPRLKFGSRKTPPK